jgi:hypothetical protein
MRFSALVIAFAALVSATLAAPVPEPDNNGTFPIEPVQIGFRLPTVAGSLG